MKLKNVEQLNLTIAQILNQSEQSKAKFKYALLRNADYLEPEAKRLQKMLEEYAEVLKPFEEKRVELVKKYGKANEDGSIKVEEGTSEMEQFQKEMEELKEEHKEAFEAYDAKIKEFNETVLEEDVDVKVYNFSADLMPDNLTTRQIAVLTLNGLIAE